MNVYAKQLMLGWCFVGIGALLSAVFKKKWKKRHNRNKRGCDLGRKTKIQVKSSSSSTVQE